MNAPFNLNKSTLGQREKNTPGNFRESQGMPYLDSTPLDYGGDDKKAGGSGKGVEIGSGASNKLKEVVLTAKSPKTIKEQVEKNISGAHSSAGNIRTATPERQQEIKSGKYTTGGRRTDMTNTELKIYEKKYGKK